MEFLSGLKRTPAYNFKGMTREKLTDNFEGAIDSLMSLTKNLCYNDLSGNHKFMVVPNQTSVDTHLDPDEVAFDANTLKYTNKLLTKDQTIDRLWSNNRVPLWINISVRESTSSSTVIELLASRRLRSEDELNHKVDRYPPFHIAVPLPPGHKEGVRFDVNWRCQQKMEKGWWAKLLESLVKITPDS